MDLYNFQQEAAIKFFKSGSLIVAIPTGGGKTIVAIQVIVEMYKKEKSEFKCLVIVPANLRSNLVDNLLKFKVKIPVSILTNKNEIDETIENNNVIIISYNFLRMYASQLLNYNWSLVACDEIHYAKSRNTINFKTLFMLRQKTKHFLGLTASPISNTPEEFFTIVALAANNLDIIKEGMQLIKYDYSGRRIPAWRKVLFGDHPKKSDYYPVGISDIDKFKQLVGKWIYIPHMDKIRSIGKRPEVKSFTVNVELDNFETKAYLYSLKKIPKLLLIDLKSGQIANSELRKIKNKLMACQQTLLSPDYIYKYKEDETIDISKYRPGSKIKTVGKYLKRTGEKTLVFTMFLTFGARLANAYFNSIGIKTKEYSGRIKPQDRKKIIEEFENGDLQVICLTGAGQEGLNLPSCKNVFFLTLPWHPETIRQVVGRALRITSKNEFVKMFWLFALMNGKETIDHWMSRIIKRKSQIRNAIFNALEESGMSVASLPSYETYKKPKIKREYPKEYY